MAVRIGVAGWAISAVASGAFETVGTHLERYAARFNAVEINSSFHRPHRATTYARWAASVGADFRFAVKLPKTMTHGQRLAGCGDLIAAFADQVAGLDDKRGPLLVQLPPSLAFDATVAEAFFALLAGRLPGATVCEPRHASWFASDVDAWLVERRITRVAADPAIVPAAADPGGWRGSAYWRLHGTPQVYRSSYGEAAIAAQAGRLAALAGDGIETWTIFDNTAAGAAVPDALALASLLRR